MSNSKWDVGEDVVRRVENAQPIWNVEAKAHSSSRPVVVLIGTVLAAAGAAQPATYVSQTYSVIEVVRTARADTGMRARTQPARGPADVGSGMSTGRLADVLPTLFVPTREQDFVEAEPFHLD